MDGPWQICRKTADEYGRIAQETGKLMRMVDPTISSQPAVRRCGTCRPTAPGKIPCSTTASSRSTSSLHSYFMNPHDSTEEYFGNIELTDNFIKQTVAIADAVAARKRSAKRIMLSFDEWNVWYKARSIEDLRKPGWPSRRA